MTNLQLDPADHTTVYASLFGYGIWRSSASLEGGDAGWKQIFKAAQQGSPTARLERTEYALTKAKDQAGQTHTRIYVGDGGFTPDFETFGDFYRTDNADKPASALVGDGSNPGFTKLSSPTNGDPGFASFNLCQGQCNYDLFVVADPRNPDVVWFGGSMVYEEIRPAAGPVAHRRGAQPLQRARGHALRGRRRALHRHDGRHADARTTSRCTPTSTRWSSTRATRTSRSWAPTAASCGPTAPSTTPPGSAPRATASPRARSTSPSASSGCPRSPTGS